MTVRALRVVTALLLAPLPAADGRAQDWHDRTDRVRAETSLEDDLRAGCRRLCDGNLRNGRLDWVKVRRLTETMVTVRVRAVWRNYERSEPLSINIPFAGRVRITEGRTVYDWTLTIEAEGRLDTATCALTITAIRVTGDRDGRLAPHVARYRDSVHHVEACGRFMTGM